MIHPNTGNMVAAEYEARLDEMRRIERDLREQRMVLIEALRPFAAACSQFGPEQPEVGDLCAHDWNNAICALSKVGAL